MENKCPLPPTYEQKPPLPPAVYINQSEFGPYPVRVVCPNCNSYVITVTRSEVGPSTWIIAGLLCIFTGWAGCCLLPFCAESCQDVEHSCSNCNAKIGLFKRL